MFPSFEGFEIVSKTTTTRLKGFFVFSGEFCHLWISIKKFVGE